MKHTFDFNYFPGFVRKSVSFSIDDGNIEMDAKFLEISRKYGLIGTFNLCSHSLTRDPQFYRDFYKGYEIANHMKYHPRAIKIAEHKPYTGEKYPKEGADPETLYDYGVEEGIYWAWYPAAKGFRPGAGEEDYILFSKEGRKELEDIFGKGSVRGFVWPYAEQDSDIVKEYLWNHSGYDSVRKTRETLGEGEFCMPKNRMAWSYTATHANLDKVGDEYEKLDANHLQFCTLGVHSVDYENAGKWDALSDFAEKFSDRTKYYSAGVSDLFAYEDATKNIVVTAEYVFNPTNIAVYGKIDGEKIILPAGGRINL